MALKPVLRGVVALILLGAAAIALHTRTPMVQNNITSSRPPLSAPTCLKSARNPRQILAHVGDAILHHLLHHTMLARLLDNSPNASQSHPIAPRRCAIAQTHPMPLATAPRVPPSGFAFGGSPVGSGSAVGSGTPIDLGASGAWSLSNLFGRANAVIMPACIDAAPPANPPPPSRAVAAAMPVRKFLPQFYGAPWTAQAGASLIALLDAYAPRAPTNQPPPPMIRIYRAWFDGHHDPAAYSHNAAAMVYRGTEALLYRIYAPPPLDCIDILERRGSPIARGAIYYRRGNRMFEVTTMFRIAQ